MKSSLPPIIKHAERLLVEIVKAVQGFTRSWKNEFGPDLRAQARKVCMLAHRAWRHHSARYWMLGKLVDEIDELKTLLQVGVCVRAFKSFAQFEMLARLASELGREAGGWKRQHHKTQNAQVVAPAQRGQILSTSAASIIGANA